MRRRTSLAVAVVAVIAALVLSGCGSTADPASPSAAASTSVSGAASGTDPTASTASTAPAAGSYVALGDSYAAAPGVPITSIAGGCFRSNHDYAHLLAAALHASLTDVTCSGATTRDLTRPQQIVQVQVPPQFDALKPTTTLVTLGIGGNDLDLFEAVLDRCLTGVRRCLQGVDVRGDTETVEQRLTKALREVHHRSPAARVVLVGYPQLIPANDTGCAGLPARAKVLGTVRRLIADFSTMMARAARGGRARYVDLIGPSAGHDICSASPWINGSRDTGQAVAFHPLPAEQQAVAHLVGQALG